MVKRNKELNAQVLNMIANKDEEAKIVAQEGQPVTVEEEKTQETATPVKDPVPTQKPAQDVAQLTKEQQAAIAQDKELREIQKLAL